MDLTQRLAQLGWGAFFDDGLRPFQGQGLSPARVAREDRGCYLVYSEQGELTAEITGRLRHNAASRGDLPTVGDWVAIRPTGSGEAMIHAILPRKSGFSRKLAGPLTEEQVIAANVDTVFLVSGLDGDLNLRRIERYLAVSYTSGARPVIVLNKADLCVCVDDRVAEVESIAPGVQVHAVSAAQNHGLEALQTHLAVGQTAAFLGSSGTGKSSLINCLLGTDRLATQPVREADSHGRHTTSHRELIRLPQGGLVIDTPGMRELQLWSDQDSIRGSFGDIDELACRCRFRDCQHRAEPGCAVIAAVEAGNMPADRLESYQKLLRELARLEKKQAQRERFMNRMNRRNTTGARSRTADPGDGHAQDA